MSMKNMIFNKKASLTLASMLVASGMASAQELADSSMINVAFGKVAKTDLMGGVSQVNVQERLKKDYSSYSLNNLQSLIGGYNGNIWGQAPLVLVDGAPRSASDINATEVEEITMLKGASAVALYGSKGAKGVILINTKRGKIQPLTIEARANTGLYVPKRYGEFLGAAEYMSLYNEALLNDDPTQPKKYSDEQIYNTAQGTNPYRYPDMDFFGSDYLRKVYNRSNATVEVTGGSRFAKYYANFGVDYNGGLIKYGEHKKDKDLNFRIRSNIDATITDWLKAFVNVGINISNKYTGRGDFWGAANTLRPNWYTGLVPISMIDPNNASLQQMVNGTIHHIDGNYLLGGSSDNQSTVFGDMLVAGYVKDKNRTFSFDVGTKADLGMITKGLNFETAFSIDYWDYYSEAYKLDYSTYEPTWGNVNGKDMIVGLTKYGKDSQSTSEYIGSSQYYQSMAFRAQFNYVNTFAKYHNVDATLAAWGFSKQNSVDENHESSSGVKGSSYHKTTNANLGLRLGYNYNHTYYAELAAAAVHSPKLAEGHREAISPSVTLGWRLSQEKWFKNTLPFFDEAKVNASYAVLNQDIDISDYYMYKGYYNMKGGWYQWQDGAQGGNTNSSVRGANEKLTFVKRKEWRIGLETSLLNGLVTLDFNYFNQLTDGLLTNGSSTLYPIYFNTYPNGSFLPWTNYNQDTRKGFDYALYVNKKIGKVDAQLGFTGQVFSSEAKHREENNGENTYLNAQGQPLDVIRGYVCEGFFTQQDIDHLNANLEQGDPNFVPKHTFGEVKAGDLKYKDVNGDGVVDSKDQVVMGKYGWSACPYIYGVNLTLKWKQFTLFAAGTGQMGAKAFRSNDWRFGTSKYTTVVRGRWTPETAATATYPRLTALDNTNNFRNSGFWIYSTDRFDLNKVQLTYDMPTHWFEGKVVSGMSVYLLGESLLTISKHRKYMETSYGSPNCRYYNLGLKMSF